MCRDSLSRGQSEIRSHEIDPRSIPTRSISAYVPSSIKQGCVRGPPAHQMLFSQMSRQPCGCSRIFPESVQNPSCGGASNLGQIELRVIVTTQGRVLLCSVCRRVFEKPALEFDWDGSMDRQEQIVWGIGILRTERTLARGQSSDASKKPSGPFCFVDNPPTLHCPTGGRDQREFHLLVVCMF